VPDRIGHITKPVQMLPPSRRRKITGSSLSDEATLGDIIHLYWGLRENKKDTVLIVCSHKPKPPPPDKKGPPSPSKRMVGKE